MDMDTFLVTLYVMVDDFCKAKLAPEVRPGPHANLTRSEVVTLAILSQWRMFGSERDFYRWAGRHLRSAFPGLPNRSQFNRLVRHHQAAIVAFGLALAEAGEYELLDTTGLPTRTYQRRGRGWLVGQADVGFSPKLHWFHGLRLLVAVTPIGMVTGYGVGSASAKDQPLAETLLAVRAQPNPRLPSAGQPAPRPAGYLADTGFEGHALQERWEQTYHARLISAPRWKSPWRWLRRRIARLRQMVETVYANLLHYFRLETERPHDMSGFQARLAAKISLHNFCIWLNRQLGRNPLQFSDLLEW
jgi:hypothetical protein